jgi:hypothetical protein
MEARGATFGKHFSIRLVSLQLLPRLQGDTHDAFEISLRAHVTVLAELETTLFVDSASARTALLDLAACELRRGGCAVKHLNRSLTFGIIINSSTLKGETRHPKQMQPRDAGSAPEERHEEELPQRKC